MRRFLIRSLVVGTVLSGTLAAVPPVHAMQFKKGSFSKSAAVGSQPITGVGFSPRAVIFFWTRQTVTDTFNAEAGIIQMGYGFSTGPASNEAVAAASEDAYSNPNRGRTAKRQSQSRCVILLADANTGSLGAEARVASLDPDGFTVDWPTNDGRADIIHYVALGGAELTDAGSGSFSTGATTGTQAVTVGFQPDFVMLLSGHQLGVDVSAVNAAQMSIGFASGPAARATVATQIEDAQAVRNTVVFQSNTLALAELPDVWATGNPPDFTMDISSFDATGFTVNKLTNWGDHVIHYLALKGGPFKVGTFSKSTESVMLPVDQPVTGVGFGPVGLILASKGKAASALAQEEGRISFGAADGAAEGATWWHDKGAGTNPTVTRMRTTTSNAAVLGTVVSAATTTLNAQANLTSFEANGFTLRWTANDSVASDMIYVAFGSTPTNYRSIGTALDYVTGTVSATSGSNVVTGSGITAWKTANRGRGDRIRIDGVDYTVLSVTANNQLTLTTPFLGLTGSPKSYVIARQFSTLQDWEDCISAEPANPCPYFGVGSPSLVADNRREVGIAYKDAPFTAGVVIGGAVTDATRDITLTVDPGSRHDGAAGPGRVILDNSAGSQEAVAILDDFVTVEWLEIEGGSHDAIRVGSLTPGSSRVVIRDCLVHDLGGDGIKLAGAEGIVDVLDNIVYETKRGVRIDQNLSGSSQVRIHSNTVYGGNDVGGPSGIDAATPGAYPTVTLWNNIAHGNLNGDFNVPGANGASSHNLSSDATAPGFFSVPSVPLTAMRFRSTTAGSENLHIDCGSAADNAGVDLGFERDIDGEARRTPWEVGADDIAGAGSCAALVTTLAGTKLTVENTDVKMVWDSAYGGGLREFYVKNEADSAINRAGDLGTNGYNLFSTQINDGTWHFETDAAGTAVPLEVTPTRVKIRQKHDYVTGANGIHLGRDWTVSPFPRLGIRETLTFDGSPLVRGVNGINTLAPSATCFAPGTFYCAGQSDSFSRVWIATDDAVKYSDMLAFPYEDPFFGRPGTGFSWSANPEVGTPNTFVVRVHEAPPAISTGPGSFPSYYQFYPSLAGLSSTLGPEQPYVIDYRTPAVLVINGGKGGQWQDANEKSELASDFFNEGESAYVLDIDPSRGLDFDIAGSRKKPVFKIRQWRSTQGPAAVTVDGATLVNGLDYRADVKPVSVAYFCPTAACGSATQLATGGLVGDAGEYLADATAGRNYELAFNTASEYLYLGSDARFRGLNVALAIAGVGSADLLWEYWNGSAWASLETGGFGFGDQTDNLKANGTIYWASDPTNWATTSPVAGGPDLYYVRAHLVSGFYATKPTEEQIRTDVLLFQYCANTIGNRRFSFSPPSSMAGPNVVDIAVTKSDGLTTVVPGDPSPIVYTITVRNDGPNAVASLTLTEVLPPALQNVSHFSSPPGYDIGTGVWDFSPGNLAAGQTATLTLSGDVGPSERGLLTNTATVTVPGGFWDPGSENDTAVDTDTLTPEADLVLDKDDGGASPGVDSSFTYTLTVSNPAGPSDAKDVVVEDTLPWEVELDLLSLPAECSYATATRLLACTFPTVAKGGSEAAVITVRAVSPGTVRNTAAIASSDVTDPVPDNDRDQQETVVSLPSTAVRFFTVTSTSGQNRLEWLNPDLPTSYLTTKIVYKHVTGSSACTFPIDENDGTDLSVPAGSSAGHHSFVHAAPNDNTTYCYGAFVQKQDLTFSAGRFVKGRPFDSSGLVEWAFSTGASALAPPGVGTDRVHAASNDNAVHAIDKGTGRWPTTPPPEWRPAGVALPSEGRPTTITTGGEPADRVIFVGSQQDRRVYAIDADTGDSTLWAPADLGKPVVAAPSGMFIAFGGYRDNIMVGSYNTAQDGVGSAFYGLKLDDGSVEWSIDGGNSGRGKIGAIPNQATVDYDKDRVYFTSYAYDGTENKTVWCIDLTTSPPSVKWAAAHGNITTSPTVLGDRLYVGTADGRVLALDTEADGAKVWELSTLDGPVKRFVMIDRSSPVIYFSTAKRVWKVQDTGADPPPVPWATPPSGVGSIESPSTPILYPGTGRLYVGSGDGNLHVLDPASGGDDVPPVPLGDMLATVGSPTFDTRLLRIYVGSEAGVIYKVQYP